MLAYRRIRTRLVFFLITQVLMLLTVLAVVSAASQEPVEQKTRVPVTLSRSEAGTYRAANGLLPAATGEVTSSVGAEPFGPLVQASLTTSLEVAILSSPWATLDHNNPTGAGEEVPNVFVVQAVITNTGTTTATGVTVALDYNEDPANNWILLAGEDPDRMLGELAAGAAYHAYWFARYSTSIGASHQYTVTALADNASSVATSDNFYGNPEPGKTVKTRGVASTGNAGVSSMGEVVVGAASTVTVDYDLGNNPLEAVFSPVGNPDFDPATYRLLASEVRFYDDAEAQEIWVSERLYFPTVPAFAQNATATFTFIAFKSAATRMCSYAAVDYQSTAKYDQFYCRDDKDTIVPISGTLTLSMTKQASSPTIQQNQRLTYTIHYTNHGNLPLAYVWVWDDVSTSTGSIITDSIDPPSNADETSESRVAWFLGDVAAWGQPGSTGTLTFTVLVDGNHQDLADRSPLVNHALFGISQASLPEEPALSSTITTTLQAPVITIGKTDGQDTAEAGERLTYTLRITNSGSVTATGLMITDLLPGEGNYISRTADPPETNRTNQTLLWENLDPIPPDGGKLVITVPVSIGLGVANGTALTNTMRVSYQNPAGWVFDTMAVTDTTTVHAPILIISKHDSPDPVLAGHLVTYTLHYTNHGSAAATGVLITDVVPMSTTYQSCSGGSACGLESGVVRWTIGSVPGGAGGAVTFSVAVSDTLRSGTLIRNEEYGIAAEQTGFVSGPLVTTRVDRSAAFFEGYTFIDANGDGRYEPGGESSLPGVTVTLASATEPITTTDSNGYYRLRVESAGAMSVTAALPPGYFRTTPSTVYTDSVFGITQTVNFGYAPNSSTFGVIYGTVFEDADHNANRDTGEQGLAGVTITSDEAAISPASTNGYGQYTLRYDMSGPVTITETNPPLYVSTTPDAVHANAVTGSSGPSPIDFGDFAGIRVTGQVFDDINVNGVKDGEPGVSGATVAAGEDSFTTTSSGVYTLYVTLNESVPVLIDEMDPAGYVSTNAVPSSAMSKVNANTLSIDEPVSGSVYMDGDFGDVLASNAVSISGQVWNDNGADGGGLANGLPDGSEPGLAGAVVSVSSGLAQTTASDGLFQLYAPPGQVITVTEGNPMAYTSTNALAGSDATKVDNDTLVVSALSGGATSTGNLFGDVLVGSISFITGGVFEDTNGNGAWDGGEMGLEGIRVTLDGAITVTTDQDGAYSFLLTEEGLHTVVETDPEGYSSTTPNEVQVQVELGNGYQVDFGDVLVSVCSCPADGYEEDDLVVQATELSVGERQTHDFCDDAHDWNSFSAEADQTYSITTSSWGQRADTYLSLFDTDGQRLLVSSDDYEGTTDYSSRIVWQAPVSGVYFVRTNNRAALSGCLTEYDMWIEQRETFYVHLPWVMRNYTTVGALLQEPGSHPAGVIDHPCPDDYELDDTWEQAQLIEPGLSQVHSFDSDPELYAADKDFVQFDIQARQTTTFTVPTLTNTQTLLEIYDEYGVPLNVTGSVQLVWKADMAGRYYLSVSPRTSAYGCAEEAGYRLHREISARKAVYLPLVVRSYTAW